MGVMFRHSPAESAMSVVTRALFTGLLLTSLSAAAVDVPALESPVDSPARADAQRARDPYRHPLQTLEFFAIAPDMTFVELWPGLTPIHCGPVVKLIGPAYRLLTLSYPASRSEEHTSELQSLMSTSYAVFHSKK